MTDYHLFPTMEVKGAPYLLTNKCGLNQMLKNNEFVLILKLDELNELVRIIYADCSNKIYLSGIIQKIITMNAFEIFSL